MSIEVAVTTNKYYKSSWTVISWSSDKHTWTELHVRAHMMHGILETVITLYLEKSLQVELLVGKSSNVLPHSHWEEKEQWMR